MTMPDAGARHVGAGGRDPQTAGTAIKLDRVSKAFGRHQVVAPLTTTFSPGAVAVLLGGNGAGKSTLLGMLGLLVRPTGGTIEFGGKSAEAAIAAGLRSRIGLLGHEPMVYRPLSGRQNLVFFGRLFGHGPEVAETWLNRLGLLAAADRPASTYSRGMLQRLALGRALIGSPRWLLLDEPFSGLDRSSQQVVRQEIAERADAGAVVIVVTHDILPLADVGRHVLVLEQGRLVHEASRETPLSRDELEALASRAISSSKEGAGVSAESEGPAGSSGGRKST